MAGFVKGNVVVVPFPFSDLTGLKRRPALVLADLPGKILYFAKSQVSRLKTDFLCP